MLTSLTPSEPAQGRLIKKKVIQTVPAKIETCKSVRQAVPWYREATWKWQRARFASLSDHTPRVRGKTCRWAHIAAKEWQGRAVKSRQAYKKWLKDHTLPLPNDWESAVTLVQRIFPGTASWLWSCSGAEGGHGQWVRYGGGSYYQGYEYTDEVGNWMQYRWSTFRGHYRNALAYLSEHGYLVPRGLRDPGDVSAWLSPLATALAAGWARYTGNDDSHWSASWGNGC